MQYSREAEEALLGAALIDPEVPTRVDLEPKHFRFLEHQVVWETLLDKGSDIVVLTEELERKGKLQEVGGPAYLSRLINSTPSSLRAEEYAEIVLDHYHNRQFLMIAEDLARQAQNGDVDIAGVIDQLAKHERVDGRAIHVKSGLSDLYETIEERSKAPKDIWGMRTGWPDFDQLTGGLQRQQTTIIAGSPEAGKTMYVVQTAMQVAQSGVPVVIYEFEMNMSRVLARLVSAESGVPTRQMFTGRITNWDGLMGAIERIEQLPLYISDAAGMTTAQLRNDVARVKAQHGVDLVVLDYLNLLQDTDGSSEIENTLLKSRRFRTICREFDCHGMTIQSLNKAGMDALQLSLSGISGPAAVSYDADNIFGMVKHESEDNVRRLLPLKLRDGDDVRRPVDLVKVPGLPKFATKAKSQFAGL